VEYGGFNTVVEARGQAVFELPGFVYLSVHPIFGVPFIRVIGRCQCVVISGCGYMHVVFERLVLVGFLS
jgi:hypothetical protein